MRVAFGLKAHSGWAALVTIGETQRSLDVLDRRRIELVEKREASGRGQPQHAAEGLPSALGRSLVEQGIAEARRNAGIG